MGVFGETLDIASAFFARLTDDQRILMQAIFMRLSTRPGTYWTDPDYGFSLRDLILAGLTADALARIPSIVQAEIEKDERVASAAVTATVTKTDAGGYRLVVDIGVTPSSAPVFAMTLAVTELSVQLLQKV